MIKLNCITINDNNPLLTCSVEPQDIALAANAAVQVTVNVDIPAGKPTGSFSLGIGAIGQATGTSHSAAVALTCGICLTPANGVPLVPMSASAQLFDFVQRHEGNNHSPNIRGDCDATRTRECHVTPDRFGLYQDNRGHCTRGIGILLHGGGSCVPGDIDAYHARFGPGGQTAAAARTEMEARVNQDVPTASRLVRVQLTQFQFDALVDFAFNAGGGLLARTDFLNNDINNQNCDPVQIENDWRHIRQSPPRQNDEIRLFNTGVYR
jgi:GH24 family phage-related lysozyme (muramidase)